MNNFLQRGWFVSPFVDLFFVCGGAVFALAYLSYITAHSGALNQASYFTGLAPVLALLLGETHTTATIVAVNQDRKWSVDFRRLSLTAAIYSAAIALAVILDCRCALPAVRLYLISVSWHFTRQAYGIVLLYCRKADYVPSAMQRRLWCCLLHLTMLDWIAVQLSNYLGAKEEIFLLHKLSPLTILPSSVVDVLVWCILVTGAIVLLDLLRRFIAWRILPPLQAMLVLFSVVLIFLPVGPSVLFQGPIWLYAPALFHGSQYLCVMADRFVQGVGELDRALVLTRLYAMALVLAVLFFITLPWLLSVIFSSWGLRFETAVVAVFIAVQVYHMAMDAVMWKRPRAQGIKQATTKLKLRAGHGRGAIVHGAVTVCLNR